MLVGALALPTLAPAQAQPGPLPPCTGADAQAWHQCLGTWEDRARDFFYAGEFRNGRPGGLGLMRTGSSLYAGEFLDGRVHVGLDESALANTPDLPLDDAAAEAVLRAGGGRLAVQMNCSGKHSGMVATCVLNDWPRDASYLSVDHPLQQRITATIADLAGETPPHIGVDGCGAPACD